MAPVPPSSASPRRLLRLGLRRLPVPVAITVIPLLDFFRREFPRLAELHGEVNGFGHVLGHDGHLQRVADGEPPGENPMIAQQDRRRAVAVPQDGLPDAVPLVVHVGRTGDLGPELVGDGRKANRDRPAQRGHGGGVIAVGMNDSAHARHVAVQIQVVRQVHAGPQLRADHLAGVQHHLDEHFRSERVVIHARRLNHQPAAAAVQAAGVARVHRHQARGQEHLLA